VAHNGSSQTVVLDLPACAIGKTKRLLFDLFDNANYQGKQIAVNNISFLAEDVNNAAYTVPTYSVFLSSASGSSGSIPPPTPTWSVLSHFMTPSVASSHPYGPGEAVYSYPKKFGQYPNYWTSINSANAGLTIAFRLYYVFGDIQLCEARQINCSSGYLGEFFNYYDAAAQQYRAWHYIEGNSLPYIGQYRAELWINGQKSTECLFDMTLESPSIFNFNGPTTANSVPLFWSILGSSVPGSGVELFRDGQLLTFVTGVSNGYNDTKPIPRVQHVYQIREVQVHPAGTFRSPYSKMLILNIGPDENMGPDAPKGLRVIN
jgi:hypothetical protein